MKKIILGMLALLSISTFAAEDCGRIKNATFESRTGILMESDKSYIIHGAAVAAATVVAVSQDLEICVYGISGQSAYGIRIKR